MRLSSKLALMVCTIGFLSLFTPALFIEDRAMSWVDIHESPPLWFYVAASFIVSAHDMEIFDGIDFIRKSNRKLTRIILLIITFLMAYAMELSVNVNISGSTHWKTSLFFGIPVFSTNARKIGIGYHLIRLARLIVSFTILDEIIERNPRRLRFEIQKLYKKIMKNETEKS